MTTSKSLPDRPSLESLRKQAKKLQRDATDGDGDAIARVRAQLPNSDLLLTRRDALLVIAREYGYAGWWDLVAEVNKRQGKGLDWAITQSRRVIHDNDVEGLKKLLADYPKLLSWHADGGLLGIATSSYGDSFSEFSEQRFTRAVCAELLIDEGAVVVPSVCDGILNSRARGLLQLFHRKDLLPRTLKFFAALGDINAVRTTLDENGNDLSVVTEAFTIACSFKHETIASLLLDQAIVLDPELGEQVDESVSRQAFIEYFIENRPANVATTGPWKAFVMEQVSRAVYSWSGSETSLTDLRGDSDLHAFVNLLHRESWVLGDDYVAFQTRLIERATLHGSGEFITALLNLNPAILRHQPPPSQAIEFAFTYANTHVIPILTRIWPLPDDLPHAAGMGDLPRVKQWFDASGAPALGDLENHYPSSPYMPKFRVEEYAEQWSALSEQRVLDVALAWSVINSHLDVADFLLQHGADINTTWSSHEPASILHELVWHKNYEAMQFLIDRGIDMTIKDYRWNSTAAGWARYAANDEKLAQWLEEAERKRAQS
ncbi:MAG TPA: ankyrin repeat domain-containing protein, partial [Pyrinomonadaceae bacterium]